MHNRIHTQEWEEQLTHKCSLAASDMWLPIRLKRQATAGHIPAEQAEHTKHISFLFKLLSPAARSTSTSHTRTPG
jgi:hypothetical protein